MDVMGFDTPLWVILVLLAIFFYTILMSRDFLTFRRMGIPGPTPLPIIGNLFAMRKGIRAFHTDAIKKYGKVCGHYEMISSTLIVADKEMLREILVKQFNNFPDRLMIEGFNGDLDHSLVSTKGNQWKHDRSIITPTFSSSKLRKVDIYQYVLSLAPLSLTIIVVIYIGLYVLSIGKSDIHYRQIYRKGYNSSVM